MLDHRNEIMPRKRDDICLSSSIRYNTRQQTLGNLDTTRVRSQWASHPQNDLRSLAMCISIQTRAIIKVGAKDELENKVAGARSIWLHG